MTAPAWHWERRRGPVDVLHDITPPPVARPTAWELEIDRPTVVRGSTQPASAIDPVAAAAAGVAVGTRRSGGGAVLLVPGDHVWIDVWVSAGSRWWDDDVVRAAAWLADVWIEALGQCGLEDLTAHAGPVVHGRWSRQVCFAGLGPGEVLAGGRKLVGISQRRTREWTRLQCVVHRRWDAAATFALLADPEARAAARQWHDAVAVVGDLDVTAAFAAALARA